jgi:sialate O-acetylesterase
MKRECLAVALAIVALAAPVWAAKEKDPNAREIVISGGTAEWGARGMRPAGEKFTVKAGAPSKDMAFVEWVGNVECLADFKSPETTLTVPANYPFHHIHIAAAYRRVPKRFVHALFQDHVVLQRDMPVPVWGWSQPGDEVKVELAGQKKTARAGADGKWLVKLDPMKASAEPQKLTVKSPAAGAEYQDVLVGDVWLCSGQSNMYGSGPAVEDTEKADYPNIRLFNNNVSQNDYNGAQPFEDLADAKNSWVKCSPDAARHWSRVAFYFGRAINQHNRVPLGIIISALDGSCIEGWMPKATLESLPEHIDNGRFKPAWNLSWGAGEMPYLRYNAHIAPLGPYAIRGVLWYQGESNGNTRSALRYRDLLTLMIRDWRKVLDNDKLPFVIIQMHLFGKLDTKREPGSGRVPWAELEESQMVVAKTVPNVGCAVTYDFGREQSLHPPDKKNISARAALVARKVAYGEDVVCCGPIYKSMKIEGDTIRVSFDDLGGGLVAKDGEPLRHFAIAGEDKKWFWADAKIDGDTVVVSSSKVKSPVAVHYAWGGGQNEANLFNKAGLPAALFRSDNWNEEPEKK